MFIFTISKLFRIVNKVAEEAFNKMDICPTHGFLMVLLQEDEEGLSVNKISETLTIAPSTVTRFVDKLVSKGICGEDKDWKTVIYQNDKRGKELSCLKYTPAGEKFLRRLNQWQEIRNIWMEFQKSLQILQN